jgi:hypothetical protein
MPDSNYTQGIENLLALNPYDCNCLTVKTLFKIFQDKFAKLLAYTGYNDEIVSMALEIIYAQQYNVQQTKDPEKIANFMRAIEDVYIKTKEAYLQNRGPNEKA